MAQAARQELADAGLTVVVAGGLIGVPRLRRFALERGSDDTVPFHLLVSLDGTGSCLVVCDATVLWPEYADEVRATARTAGASAVLAIVTARPGALTANLVAPPVREPVTRSAREILLDEPAWSPRTPP